MTIIRFMVVLVNGNSRLKITQKLTRAFRPVHPHYKKSALRIIAGLLIRGSDGTSANHVTPRQRFLQRRHTRIRDFGFGQVKVMQLVEALKLLESQVADGRAA